VGAEHDALVGVGRARDLGQHIVADQPVDLQRIVGGEGGPLQGHRREAGGAGPQLLGLEVEPGLAEQVHGQVALDPGLQQQARLRRVLAHHVVALAVGGHHRGPGIGRAGGLMDDQGADGPAADGFLVLVAPAGVVGRRLAAEFARDRITRLRLEVRVVDQDDRDLALQVDALEVVPAPLGSADAVADEDQRGVGDGHPVHRTLAGRHDVGGLDQGAVNAAGRQGEARVARHDEPVERHFLGPAAVVAGGLQTQGAELADQIVDGQRLARTPRRAAGELGGAQHLHMGGQGVGRDDAGIRRQRRGGEQGGQGQGGERAKDHVGYSHSAGVSAASISS